MSLFPRLSRLCHLAIVFVKTDRRMGGNACRLTKSLHTRPVYSLILGTKVMIVLTSDQAIKDLLDKRSNIYSSRPDMYLTNILSGGLRMLAMVSQTPRPPLTSVIHVHKYACR